MNTVLRIIKYFHVVLVVQETSQLNIQLSVVEERIAHSEVQFHSGCFTCKQIHKLQIINDLEHLETINSEMMKMISASTGHRQNQPAAAYVE